ncbi:Hypothetical_protein [Hexamita inflata]|uniref:Hypothetical_protein n=1 Tax=Hexamita inflata TaxID=28002 RepID=A0AA86PEZ4_9EUKA|nr:Hypothetical protein HINF_LOCUS22120 [Hexamita inflata]CAI9937934.1 Hypothetical protein HINF_LOCUS25579 [Hexamita inflata]
MDEFKTDHQEMNEKLTKQNEIILTQLKKVEQQFMDSQKAKKAPTPLKRNMSNAMHPGEIHKIASISNKRSLSNNTVATKSPTQMLQDVILPPPRLPKHREQQKADEDVTFEVSSEVSTRTIPDQQLISSIQHNQSVKPKSSLMRANYNLQKSVVLELQNEILRLQPFENSAIMVEEQMNVISELNHRCLELEQIEQKVVNGLKRLNDMLLNGDIGQKLYDELVTMFK